MVYSTCKLQRILDYYFQGYKVPTISKLLREEKLKARRVGIAKFLKKYEETGSIGRRPGSGRLTKVTAEIKAVVGKQMRKDDETTATQLHALLTSRGYSISLRTILRCRSSLGWTYRGSAYCQFIRDANKQKRLAWAEQIGTYKDEDFEEVIWTDECTIQLETHVAFVVENVESRLGRSQGNYSSIAVVCIYP
jgi:transposase